MKKNIYLLSFLYIILLAIPFATVMIISGNIKKDSVPASKVEIQEPEQTEESNPFSNQENISEQQENTYEQSDIEKSQIQRLKDIISTSVSKESTEDIPKESVDGGDKVIDKSITTDGYFKILNMKTNKIDYVKQKDYVIGAVCAEMPPTFHEEALKAQAISAHTYALKMKKEQDRNPDRSLKGAHFSANPESWQKYVTKELAKKRFKDKFDEYWGKIESATNEVIDIIMLYDDEPIIAAYHSMCGGKTESASDIWGGEAPYLQPAESVGDKFAPNYETVVTLKSKDVKKRLCNSFPSILLENSPSCWFSDLSRSDSGSILSAEIGNKIVSGNKLRCILGLRSAYFNVFYNPDEDSFNFEVEGYGHGIGLSQYGADYMARNGCLVYDILKHYYSDICFARVSCV